MSRSEIHSTNDWHSEDIKCAIRKKGVSMADLARANGYKVPRTFSNVFTTSYPKVERIIAEFLEVSPEVIWPSRYQKAIEITPSVHRRVA
ncbi:MAG: helix-turn-helix domain-containing protein [Oleispira sp.]|nr:helix-turn-helix domain-containing protein [Oleispira sp.]